MGRKHSHQKAIFNIQQHFTMLLFVTGASYLSQEMAMIIWTQSFFVISSWTKLPLFFSVYVFEHKRNLKSGPGFSPSRTARTVVAQKVFCLFIDRTWSLHQNITRSRFRLQKFCDCKNLLTAIRRQCPKFDNINLTASVVTKLTSLWEGFTATQQRLVTQAKCSLTKLLFSIVSHSWTIWRKCEDISLSKDWDFPAFGFEIWGQWIYSSLCEGGTELVQLPQAAYSQLKMAEVMQAWVLFCYYIMFFQNNEFSASHWECGTV